MFKSPHLDFPCRGYKYVEQSHKGKALEKMLSSARAILDDQIKRFGPKGFDLGWVG